MIWFLVLILYLLGVVATICVMWVIHKKSGNKKISTLEILLSTYVIALSWIGFLSIIAGCMAGFNNLNDEI